TSSWKENHVLSKQAGITAFIFTDHFLIVIGQDSLMTVFDLDLQKRKDSLLLNVDVSSLDLCQAADRVAIAWTDANETEIKLYNAETSIITPIVVPDALRSFALSNDGKWLATVSDDNIARLWQTNGVKKT